MKRLLTIITILVTMVIASCDKYDDSEIRQKIDALEERVTSVETLLKAYTNKLTIVDIEETEDKIIITFSDNSKITINQAQEVNSPIVNVKVDGNIVYITLDDGTILTFKLYEETDNESDNENCKIYYTTTDGKKIDWSNIYDPNSFVHRYENSQGILIFDKPVIYVACPYWTTLETIIIPESVEEVGSFFNCKNLKTLYCKAITPPITPQTVYEDAYIVGSKTYDFLDCDNIHYTTPQPIGCTIYVPEESVDAYKKAERWSRYAGYIKGYNFE